MARDNRKAEKPIICFVRLYGAEKMRMLAVCRDFSTDHNAVARAGIGAEVLRLERHAEAIDEATAMVIAEARALDIDPVTALRAAIAAKVSST